MLVCTGCSHAVPSDNLEIRKTDFRNFDYQTCFDSIGKTTHITKGKYSAKVEDGVSSVSFLVVDVTYGDLDSDGKEEAVVTTECNGGGTGHFTDGLIYQIKDGRPVHIGNLGEGDRAIGGIHEVRISDGRLEVDRYGSYGGACCPDYIETSTYKLQGMKLAEQGKPVQRDYVRADGEYSVRRVHFARGESSTVLTGSVGREADYLIGARAGQSMMLKVSGSHLTMTLEAPEGADIAQPLPNEVWSANLPTSGDYRLKISSEDNEAKFSVEISIR